MVLVACGLIALAPIYLWAWTWFGRGAWTDAWPVVTIMVVGGILLAAVGTRLADPRRTHQ